MTNNAKNNLKQRGCGKQLGGVTGRGFMPGRSGNPKGRPPTRGLVNALKARVAEVTDDGRSVEEALADVLINEALHGRNKLAAVALAQELHRRGRAWRTQHQSHQHRGASTCAFREAGRTAQERPVVDPYRESGLRKPPPTAVTAGFAQLEAGLSAALPLARLLLKWHQAGVRVRTATGELYGRVDLLQEQYSSEHKTAREWVEAGAIEDRPRSARNGRDLARNRSEQ
jgi:hypothetical protein